MIDQGLVRNVAKRTQRRARGDAALLAVIFCTLLAAPGCEAPLGESAADRAARTALAGQWHWRHRDPASGALVEVVTARAPDGGFVEQSVSSDADGRVGTVREQGQWFVQDGVLKMRTHTVDGEPIGKNSRLAFRTYDIVAVDGDRVRLRPSAENGVPGLWPRVTGIPRRERVEMPVIEQKRVGEPPMAGGR